LKDLIPKGSIVYLSTDDPDGVCQNCVAQRKPCDSFQKGSKPTGCPEDPSWKALSDAGWEVRKRTQTHVLRKRGISMRA